MKKISYIIGIFIATLASSCFKLDQEPYETFGENTAFKTATDAKAWRNGMYSRLREYAYNHQMVLPEVQADNLNLTSFTDGYIDNLHRWETFLTDENATAQLWQNAYRAIADINKALIGFDQIQDQNSIRHYRGELHLARAYYYTSLITLFCKAYDPATANTDLGLILIKDDDFTKAIARSSLKESYDFILSDIAEAETFLAGKDLSDKTSFTKDSANALKTRVLFYMQEWQQAYDLASSLINSGNYPLAFDEATLGSIWYNDDASESITQLMASNIKQEQAEIHLVKYYQMRDESPYGTFYNPALLPTKSLIDLYEDTDFRKNVYFSVQELYDISGNAENFYIVEKFPGNPALKTSNDVSYAHKPNIFRIGEIYTIAFESAYRKGDEANALRILNELKTARGASSVTLSGSSLLEEIKNERTRELAFEGFRLIDLKRWKEAVVRGEPQHLGFIITTPATQYHELRRSAADHKFVWPIPSDDISVYLNVVKQNEGW